MSTYTKGGSDDTWIFPGSLSVAGTFTATGTETTTLDATEVALEIDAQTTDHTSGNIISMNIDAATGSTNGVAIDIDVPTTLLGAAARVYGTYVDINGKNDDNVASEMAAFYATSANTTAGVNRGLQLAGTFDTGIEVGSAATDGILISGATTDAIHVSGATTNGINLAGTSSAAGIVVAGVCADGILVSSANADGLHISGANTANAIHISGDQAVGILFTATESAVTGVHLATPTGKTVTTGLLMNGAGTVTTGIDIAPEAATYGISIGLTGKTYTGGILLGTGGGTITTGISMLGTHTVGINFGGTAVTTGIAFSSTCTTGISMTGAVTTGLDIAGSAMTTGISIGVTGKTYATGIACGVTGGTLTDALSFNGTVTAAITVLAAATMTNFIDFNAVAGCVVANALIPAVAPDATTMGADACITIDINGTPYYIPLYNSLHA